MNAPLDLRVEDELSGAAAVANARNRVVIDSGAGPGDGGAGGEGGSLARFSCGLQRFQEIMIQPLFFDMNSQTGKPIWETHLCQFCLPSGLRLSIQHF